MNQLQCVFREDLYFTSLHGSHVIATDQNLLSYSSYDIHSKILYGGAVIAAVVSTVHNASDMLSDRLCMEFART